MRKIAYTFLLLLLPFISFAQSGYKLAGTAKDAEGKPVAFATVSLWIAGQATAYKATNANENGEYSFEQIAQGTYNLKAEMVGYTTQEKQVVFDAQTLPTTVQNIALPNANNQLKEVVMEGQKEFIETTPDAVIIRPDANPATQGGTATDVLQQTPNVQVDANGNITMRGGRPNVMVNGRMSGMGDMRRGGGGGNPLDQINAEDIESISISTNPSARFDAEGGGGLIDVRLKRDRQLGTHGMLSIGGGVPRGRMMSNFRINHRTKKTNVFIGYGGRIDNRLGDGETERKTLNLDQSLRQMLDQNSVSANHGFNHNIRFGGDYYFTDKTSLGFEGSYGIRDGRNDETTTSNFINNFTTNAIDSLTRQLNKSTSMSNNLDYSLIFHHEFKKPKQELNITFSQVFGQDDSNNDLNIQHLFTDFTSTQNPTLRRTDNGNANMITNFQADYATPHGKKGVFEVGTKITMRDLNTDSYVENFEAGLNDWLKDIRISNTFAFNESVQAGYLAYRNSLNKWDYSVGLRGENVIMTGKVVAVENSDFRKDFFNLFPTARIAYNINKDQFIKLAFARRISRPNFGDLNPFVDISNPLNYRQGNPAINPEFMYNFELGYNRIWDKFTFSPAIFYRLRTNVVQRINVLDAETGISTSMPENIGQGNNYGVELTGSGRFTKWWDLNVSYTFFQNDIIADQVGRGVNSSINSSNIRINNIFTFWNNARLSFNTFYNSATAIAQGTVLPVFGMGMGFQKPLDSKRKASIGVNVRDMFYTMRFGSETQGINFAQNSYIRRDTRVVMANFRYRF
jgi:outer membrane receptor protein involved in Fe transport